MSWKWFLRREFAREIVARKANMNIRKKCLQQKLFLWSSIENFHLNVFEIMVTNKSIHHPNDHPANRAHEFHTLLSTPHHTSISDENTSSHNRTVDRLLWQSILNEGKNQVTILFNFFRTLLLLLRLVLTVQNTFWKIPRKTNRFKY